MKKIHLYNRVTFTCPFCGLPGALGYLTEAEDKPAVIHASPMCGRFKALDGLDYLQAVHRKISEGLPS